MTTQARPDCESQSMDTIIVKRSLSDFIKWWRSNAQAYRAAGEYERAAGIENLLEHLEDKFKWILVAPSSAQPKTGGE